MKNKKQRPNTSYHSKERSFSPGSLISPLPTPAFPDFQRIEKIVMSCNEVAIQNMSQGDFDSSFSLLKKAEFLLEHTALDVESKQIDRNHLLDITYNNLGCYYKRKNKPNVALNYLMKVLLIQERLGKEKIDVAATNLNISAILSQLTKHKQALGYAKFALELAKDYVKDVQEKGRAARDAADSMGGDRLTSLQERSDEKQNTSAQPKMRRPVSGKSQNSELISTSSDMRKEANRGTTPDNDSQIPFTEPGGKTQQAGYSQGNNPSASSPNLKIDQTKGKADQSPPPQKMTLKQTSSGPRIETQSSAASDERKRPSTGVRRSQHGSTGPIPEVSRDHEDEQDKSKEVPPSAAATFAIAYHNVGAEYEHLGDLRRAINVYKSALQETRELFPGMSDSILKTIEEALEDCKEKYKKRQQLHFNRLKQRAIKSTAMMYNDRSHLQSVDLRKLQNRTFSGGQIGLGNTSQDPLNHSATAKPITAGLASINQSRSILGSRQKLATAFSGTSFKSGAPPRKRMASMGSKRSELALIKQYGWNGSMSGTQMRGLPSLGNSLDISHINLQNLNSIGSSSDIGAMLDAANPLAISSPKSEVQLHADTASYQHLSPQPIQEEGGVHVQQAYFSPPQIGRSLDFNQLHKRLLARKFQSDGGHGEEQQVMVPHMPSMFGPKGKLGRDGLRLQEILRKTKYISNMGQYQRAPPPPPPVGARLKGR